MENTALIIFFIFLLPVLFLAGYLLGKRDVREQKVQERIEEYPFYPFITNEQGLVEFSQPKFNAAVQYLIRHKNSLASLQLIIIGEQNIVRDILGSADLSNYMILYRKHDGQELLAEQNRFMENYKRIVSLIGRSFKGTGIEILLHNLVNPTKSVIAIENGEVTGRKLENGTTNLLLDLKTRNHHNQDKLNYELRIGARLFKCTTIPIFRRDYGLVGAICINVDANFIRNEVMSSKARLEAFIDNLLKTDFLLGENILSKDEYQAALAGKRFFTDDVFHKSGNGHNKRLMAILFSDIVSYSTLMGRDESEALRVLSENRRIHERNLSANHGILLKEIGDGILAGFDSVSDAVQCALQIQRDVKETEHFALRIGIHLGEVNAGNNDILGDGVNIASRIQSLAEPGTVFISGVVYDNIRNKLEMPAEYIGEKMLKNIDEAVRIFKLV